MLTGQCRDGWECKLRENCPAFRAEQTKLEALTSFSPEWLRLVSELKALVCNKEAKGVCCKITGGESSLFLHDMDSLSFSGRCEEGWRCKQREHCPEFKEEQTKLDALPSFSSQWLEILSKLKDLECNVLDGQLHRWDRLAFFRDLIPGPTNHESGQFYIPIVELFSKEGRSDLAILRLAFSVNRSEETWIPFTAQVQEHPDYKKGAPLKHLNLAIEEPKPGDTAITAVSFATLLIMVAKNIFKGWGLTRYNKSPGSPLRSLKLTVTKVFSCFD